MSKRFACGWPEKTFVDAQGLPALKVCPCGWVFPEKIEAEHHQKRTPKPIQREFVFGTEPKTIKRERLPIQRERL